MRLGGVSGVLGGVTKAVRVCHRRSSRGWRPKFAAARMFGARRAARARNFKSSADPWSAAPSGCRGRQPQCVATSHPPPPPASYGTSRRRRRHHLLLTALHSLRSAIRRRCIAHRPSSSAAPRPLSVRSPVRALHSSVVTPPPSTPRPAPLRTLGRVKLRVRAQARAWTLSPRDRGYNLFLFGRW